MRVLVCDDDEAILAQLKAYLLEYFAQNRLEPPELCLYSDGSRLLEDGDSQRADLAFLDVEMPQVSGIDVGARLAERSPRCKIFMVTSYPDYLDDAMRFHVFRYLSKPLDKKRLFRNLKEALCQLSVDTHPVFLETGPESLTLYADEIVLVESQGRRAAVQTVERRYLSTQPMRHWEQALLDIGSFYQPHRSFLVNMKFVRRFSGDLITLCVPNGGEYRAYLTRRRYKNFKNAYMLYLEATR